MTGKVYLLSEKWGFGRCQEFSHDLLYMVPYRNADSLDECMNPSTLTVTYARFVRTYLKSVAIFCFIYNSEPLSWVYNFKDTHHTQDNVSVLKEWIKYLIGFFYHYHFYVVQEIVKLWFIDEKFPEGIPNIHFQIYLLFLWIELASLFLCSWI